MITGESRTSEETKQGRTGWRREEKDREKLRTIQNKKLLFWLHVTFFRHISIE